MRLMLWFKFYRTILYVIDVMSSHSPKHQRNLRENKTGVILTADKGVALVVMDNPKYTSKA